MDNVKIESNKNINNIRKTIYSALSEIDDTVTENDKFYGSSAWKKTRAAVRLRDDDVDVWELLKTGRIVHCKDTGGFPVHHIIPKNVNPDLALDMNNLITVSPRSHSEIEKIYYNGSPETVSAIQNILTAEAQARTRKLIHNDYVDDSGSQYTLSMLLDSELYIGDQQ